MKVGVDDDGTVVGVKYPKSDMKSITDTIANKLSIHTTVNVDETTNVITINVQRSPVPVDLDGKFYIRTGNTTHAATGREYDMLASRRLNISWSEMPIDGLGISCLDGNAIDYFRKKARDKGAISDESLDVSDRDLLIKLKLMTRDGVLTRAAILLFHPNPEDVILGSSVKVGMFEGTDSPEILFQDYVNGSLISIPDRLCDLINVKYSKKRISYKGLNMVETSPFPEKGLREAILNAVMHNDYGSGIPIQIRIWEDRMRIADSGGIPYNWTEEELDQQTVDILSTEYLDRLRKIPGLNTKAKLLERLAKVLVFKYSKVNKLRSATFSERLNKLVDKYNHRHDVPINLSEFVDVMLSFVEDISGDMHSGDDLGMGPGEKAFYDILVKMTELYHFEFDKDIMKQMAPRLKEVTDNTCSILDWSTRDDVKAQLRWNIVEVLEEFGFPPISYVGVYQHIFDQMERYKMNSV